MQRSRTLKPLKILCNPWSIASESSQILEAEHDKDPFLYPRMITQASPPKSRNFRTSGAVSCERAVDKERRIYESGTKHRPISDRD